MIINIIIIMIINIFRCQTFSLLTQGSWMCHISQKKFKLNILNSLPRV